MNTIAIVFLVFLIVSLIVNIIMVMMFLSARKQYEVLSSLEQFEDNLLLQLIAISEGIVQDVNKFFSENLIASIPEMQSLMMYVRKMRDLYRIQIREYNAHNRYRNRIIVEELLDRPEEEEEPEEKRSV